jgi:hypothetical protein
MSGLLFRPFGPVYLVASGQKLWQVPLRGSKGKMHSAQCRLADFGRRRSHRHQLWRRGPLHDSGWRCEIFSVKCVRASLVRSHRRVLELAEAARDLPTCRRGRTIRTLPSRNQIHSNLPRFCLRHAVSRSMTTSLPPLLSQNSDLDNLPLRFQTLIFLSQRSPG